MSDILKLGQLIDADAKRDAIHIAVAPVVASEYLDPGEGINFVDGSTTLVRRVPFDGSIGIVDPFLRKPIRKGDRFWMWLNPYTITSLRHDWTHPAFQTMEIPLVHPLSESSISWIRNYAEELGVDYDDLMIGARVFQDTGDHYYGPDEYGSYGTFGGMRTNDEFWGHWEKVTGRKANNEGNFFSCSC
jgi:hypothetical protein